MTTKENYLERASRGDNDRAQAKVPPCEFKARGSLRPLIFFSYVRAHSISLIAKALF